MRLLTISALVGAAFAETHKIGSGKCQVMAGYDFFDLKNFDEFDRNKDKHTPANIDGFFGHKEFIFKACQPTFSMKDSYTDHDMESDCSTIEAGNAYWVDSGSCKYSFKDAVFVASNVTEGEAVDSDDDKEEDGGEATHDGFTLTYTS